MSDRDGGPAFPFTYVHPDTRAAMGESGMSLRDYFAAKAMHAELVTAGALEQPAVALAKAAEAMGQSIEERIAFNAYALADAMLAERAEKELS